MVIDLDPWIDLDKWGNKKTEIKGVVEVLEKCLPHKITMPTPSRNNRHGTPRKKSMPRKYKEFFVKEPSGYCPKCFKYVKETDHGVVCPPCQAYWHYTCAGVTQQMLDEEWKDSHFFCIKHRTVDEYQSSETSVDLVKPVTMKEEENNSIPDPNIKIVNARINNYALNVQAKIKEKLSKMEKEFKITPKDSNRQYHLEMSTPTYHLFIENFVQFGEDIGLDVKLNDADSMGQMVKTQFTMNISTGDGIEIPLSLTCYHTTNTMLVQLMGNKSVAKLKHLNYFMNTTMTSIIHKLEKCKEHKTMKEMLMGRFGGAQSGGLTGNLKEQPCLNNFLTPIPTVSGENMGDEVIHREVSSLPGPLGQKAPAKASQKTVTPTEETKEDKLNEIRPSAEKNNSMKVNCDAEKCPNANHHQCTSIINQLKVKLAEEDQEKKAVQKELVALQKQLKDAEGKMKANKSLQEKLDKTSKLKDQMSAAVLSLKQENGALKTQQDTKNLTIDQQKDTIQSYSTIISDYEDKLSEKDKRIKEWEDKVKKQGIGFELHRDMAFKFMEVANEEGLAVESTGDQDNNTDVTKIYTQLLAEESKVAEITRELSTLQAELQTLRDTSSKNDALVKEADDKLKEQSQQQELLKEERDTYKKDSKKLKDALSESEKARNSLNDSVKQLEAKISELNTEKVVQHTVNQTHDVNKEVVNELQVMVNHLQASLDQEKKLKQEVQDELKTIRQTQKSIEETDEALKFRNQKITEMTQLFREKENEIVDLKNYVKFTDESLKEKDLEIHSLKSKIQEMQLENTEIIKFKSELESKYRVSTKQGEELQNKCSSLQNQIQQLLYLNDQLKIKTELLEAKVQDQLSQHNNPNTLCRPEILSSHLSILNNNDLNSQKYCYAELKEKGSCAKHKENKCRFEHSIPEDFAENRENILKTIDEKNLCINEFEGEGNCAKKELCRFHHNITHEQRKNPVLRGIMQRKRMRMIQNRKGGGSKDLCVFEFQGINRCMWGEKCHFDHKITEEQRNNEQLKEKMVEKSKVINKGKKSALAPDNHEKQSDEIPVPVKVLEQMYTLLHAFNPAAALSSSRHF